MCTAIRFKTAGAYFGRNLDLEHRFDESITITPRDFPLRFREIPEMKSHNAMIGMAFVAEGYPLYYDAMNEHGLFAAGLNFPKNAVYKPKSGDLYNIAPFELIPFLLGKCSAVDEVKSLLEHANILSTDFSKNLPNTPLHWFVADKEKSITVEPTAEGIKIHENPVSVLTNNPPFEYQMLNLQNFLSISPYESGKEASELYSRGLGAMGLPGDLSSMSRFVRAVFTKENSVCGGSEEESITQFFHILSSVSQTRGCVRLPEEKLEKTVYSSCASAESGIYYYKTYENSRICAVDMKKEELSGSEIKSFPLFEKQDILFQN